MVLPSPLLLGYSHQKTGIHLISQIIFDKADDACSGVNRRRVSGTASYL